MPDSIKKHRYSVGSLVLGLMSKGVDNIKKIIHSYDDYCKNHQKKIADDTYMVDKSITAYAWLPFYVVKQDFLSSVKPYDSRHELWRDLLQPFRGLLNIGHALFELLKASILVFIPRKMTFPEIKQMYLFSFTHFTTGLLQIMTTPLNVFFRIPLRKTVSVVKAVPVKSSHAQVHRALGTQPNAFPKANPVPHYGQFAQKPSSEITFSWVKPNFDNEFIEKAAENRAKLPSSFIH